MAINASQVGLLIVYTGQGKGKTTAALGLVLRALGHGLRPCVLQFIKSERGRWGEAIMAERLGIAWRALGKGFVFDPARQREDAELAQQGWAMAQAEIASGAYDLVWSGARRTCTWSSPGETPHRSCWPLLIWSPRWSWSNTHTMPAFVRNSASSSRSTLWSL